MTQNVRLRRLSLTEEHVRRAHRVVEKLAQPTSGIRDSNLWRMQSLVAKEIDLAFPREEKP
jgi:hypothetical protein